MPNKYTVGRQPCDNYKAQKDGNAYNIWDNVHECFIGDGCTVSFCENCYSDHHSNGYESCHRESVE